MTKEKNFYAKVIRMPDLRQFAPGCHRVNFAPWRRYIGETIIILAITGLLAWWISRVTGSISFVVLLPIVVGYSIGALRMQQMAKQFCVEIREGILWAGSPSPAAVGKIAEVIHVDLSGHEDLERSENGSSRIYVKVSGTTPPHELFPLFISSVTLKPLARQMAKVTEATFRHGKGRSHLPEGQ